MTTATHVPHTAIQYLYAFLIATSLVFLIDARTNSMPPQDDALYYVDMARSGIIGNARLVAHLPIGPACLSQVVRSPVFCPSR